MKNRIITIVVTGLVMLAVIGVLSSLFSDPVDFFKSIAIMLVVVAVIYFLVTRFYKSGPGKRDQRAFVKAAKRSAKRHKSGRQATKTAKDSVTSIKKLRIKKNNPNPHLTVIEGKKGKKKNRASF